MIRTRRPFIDRLEPRQLFSVIPGFTESTLAAGLNHPTAMAFAPDGRLFVCEQDGSLRVIKDGTLLPDPFVSLNVATDGERGLLGVAFDPAFDQNGFVYTYYTTPDPAVHNRISRFVAVGDLAQAGSEQVLVNLPDLSAATNHNGGAIHFGPDGKLYVGVGDNNDSSNAQPLTTPLGKLLRFNADGTIPSDNPFIAETTGLSQAIWATGLRNPYTFAFDPVDGRLHVNDVGLSSFEEINVGSAGANFGWPLIEGKRRSQRAPDRYVDPLFAYPHSGGKIVGSAIAGGAFYEPPVGAGQAFPASLAGNYFFSDWGAGFIKSIDPVTRKVSDFASGLSGPVDLQEGPDGSLYALEYFAGQVTRLTAKGPDFAVELRTEPPGQVLQGDSGRAAIVIRNEGGAIASGSLTIRLLASSDSVADTGDLVLTEQTRIVKLKPGVSKRLNRRFAYPDTLAGDVFWIAEIVPADTAANADPSNDSSSSANKVSVAAPFVDVSPAFREPVPATVVRGRRSSVVVEIRNAGNVTLTGRLAVRLSASSAGSVPDTLLVDATPKVKIREGKTKALRLKFTPTVDLAAGVYFFRVDLNQNGLIVESDTSNDGAISAGSFAIV